MFADPWTGASANSATAGNTYPLTASLPEANVRTYEIRPKPSVASGYLCVKEISSNVSSTATRAANSHFSPEVHRRRRAEAS